MPFPAWVQRIGYGQQGPVANAVSPMENAQPAIPLQQNPPDHVPLWRRLVGLGLGMTQLGNPANAANVAAEVVGENKPDQQQQPQRVWRASINE